MSSDEQLNRPPEQIEPNNPHMFDEALEVECPPRYGLEEGIAEAVRMVEYAHENVPANQMISVFVAGGSASGKTSAVAERIRSTFGHLARITSLDDYSKGIKYIKDMASQGVTVTFDEPDYQNTLKFREDMIVWAAGGMATKPIYSFISGEPDQVEFLMAPRILIVEGLFALHDSVHDLAHLKIFVDTGMHGRLKRRLDRDLVSRGEKPADILKYFADVVQPMHEAHVQPSMANADMVIENEYNPAVEAEHGGVPEHQIKFETEVGSEKLLEAGAQEVAVTMQQDFYYNPPDRDFRQTGEILRLRIEDERQTVTFKGPKRADSDYVSRRTTEIELEPETAQAVLNLYGPHVLEVNKIRVLYKLGGVNFALDEVYKTTDGGENVAIGRFVELRLTGQESEAEIDEVLLKLGLEIKNGKKISYWEM